jgi:hypothetical protein
LLLIVCPDPDKSQSEQNTEFEETIKVAEGWIDERKAANWASYSASI